jgi:hypothetical protein
MYVTILTLSIFCTSCVHQDPSLEAGKAELSPVRGAGHEPPVQAGEPMRVAMVGGRYDKPTHRPHKSSKSRQ